MAHALAEDPIIEILDQQEQARVESLQTLISYLENAERHDFGKLFSYAIRVLELDQDSVAREFKISRPTVSRWEAGKSAPHPLGRPPVFQLLRKVAKQRLRQHSL